jgi:hypothetical protein
MTWNERAVSETFELWRRYLLEEVGVLPPDHRGASRLRALLIDEADLAETVFAAGWLGAAHLIHDFAARAGNLTCLDEHDPGIDG